MWQCGLASTPEAIFAAYFIVISKLHLPPTGLEKAGAISR